MILAVMILAFSVQLPTFVKVATIDGGKVKGEPTRLAWSPDGAQFFLQTAERDNVGMIKNPRSYLLDAATGRIEPVSAEPEWAVAYLAWKAGQKAPGSPSLSIDIKNERKTVASTSSPMGGALARGGADTSGAGGTTADEVANARLNQQTLNVTTLTLLGETVGEFVGVQFIPGYTFGWSPKERNSIAFVTPSGRLTIMDGAGKKQQIDGPKNVFLPAWSGDGKRIAFLQRTGKDKCELVVFTVTP